MRAVTDDCRRTERKARCLAEKVIFVKRICNSRTRVHAQTSLHSVHMAVGMNACSCAGAHTNTWLYPTSVWQTATHRRRAKFNHFPIPGDIYMTHTCENIKAALGNVWRWYRNGIYFIILRSNACSANRKLHDHICMSAVSPAKIYSTLRCPHSTHVVYARAQTRRRVLNVQPFFPLFLSSPTHFYGAHTQTHIRKQLQCQRLPTHQPITTAQLPYACRWYKQTTQNALPRSNQSEKSASVICYEQVLWRKLTGNVLSRQSEFTAGKLIVDIMKQ